MPNSWRVRGWRANRSWKWVSRTGRDHVARAPCPFCTLFRFSIALVRFWWSTVLFPSRTSSSLAATTATCGPTRWGWAGNSLAVAVLGLLSGWLFLGNLTYPLFEPDESRYAQVALEMLQSGDFVVPRLLGEPFLHKPPLLYWATAASLRVFGPCEFGARFPLALAAILTVLVTFVLGARLLGSRRLSSRR